MSVMRLAAVYYDSTYRHDGEPCCSVVAGLHLKERTDVEVEGRWGADNGMFYWRARLAPVSPWPEGVPLPRWSTWRPHEPGTVVTQEELYWSQDHPSGPVYPPEKPAFTCWYCAAEGEDPAWFAWWTSGQFGTWLCGDCWNHVGIPTLEEKMRSDALMNASAFASYTVVGSWAQMLHDPTAGAIDRVRERIMDSHRATREDIMRLIRHTP